MAHEHKHEPIDGPPCSVACLKRPPATPDVPSRSLPLPPSTQYSAAHYSGHSVLRVLIVLINQGTQSTQGSQGSQYSVLSTQGPHYPVPRMLSQRSVAYRTEATTRPTAHSAARYGLGALRVYIGLFEAGLLVRFIDWLPRVLYGSHRGVAGYGARAACRRRDRAG